MKQRIIILALLASFLVFMGCDQATDSEKKPDPIPVESVTITPNPVTIELGSTRQLNLTFTPGDATNKTVTWTSADTAIATVSATGLVSAKAVGSTVITVTTADGSKTDICNAKVDPVLDTGELIDNGIEKIKDGDYDSAIQDFENAFNKDKDNPSSNTFVESVVYSSLAKLATIPTDVNFRNLLKDRLGVKNYPNTIEDLILGDWMETYTVINVTYSYDDDGRWVYWFDPLKDPWLFEYYELDEIAGYYAFNYDIYTYELVSTTERHETQLMPGLEIPEWFGNTSAYKDTLVDGKKPSPETFGLLLLANLVQKNSNGLNDLLDDLLNTMFGSGSAFQTVVSRTAMLPSYNSTFTVGEDILDAFGLLDLFEGPVDIGKAELELIISALRLLKASFEWIAAYDWNTDISFLKTEWKNLEDNIDKLNPANLPFRNNFLKARNNTKMAESKASYILAINTTISVYDHYTGATSNLPKGIKDELNKIKWIKDGLSKLKKAIEDGTTFYVKEGTGSTYDNTASNAEFGIHFGKFFTAGYFGIDKLITTTGTGANVSPAFYGLDDKNNEVLITNKDDIGQYNTLGFQLKLTPLKEVFVSGFEFPSGNVEYLPIFNTQMAEKIYAKYY